MIVESPEIATLIAQKVVLVAERRNRVAEVDVIQKMLVVASAQHIVHLCTNDILVCQHKRHCSAQTVELGQVGQRGIELLLGARQSDLIVENWQALFGYFTLRKRVKNQVGIGAPGKDRIKVANGAVEDRLPMSGLAEPVSGRELKRFSVAIRRRRERSDDDNVKFSMVRVGEQAIKLGLHDHAPDLTRQYNCNNRFVSLSSFKVADSSHRCVTNAPFLHNPAAMARGATTHAYSVS